MRFVGVKIDVVEDRDSFDRLLDDLRTPARLRPGVVTLATMEAQHFQGFHEIEEMFARRTKSMVIVIGPAQA